MYHGFIKLGFTADNYSFDMPVNVYVERHIFEHSAWFDSCHVFEMWLTYKIGQNDFDVIYVPTNLEKVSWLRCKLFYYKDIFQIVCLNHENRFILAHRSIFFFFSKSLTLSKLKKKMASLSFWSLDVVFCTTYVNPKN